MEFNKEQLKNMDEDQIAQWGEYADYISQSDPDFAEQIYQKILSIDGNHTTALSNYAEFLQDQGRNKEVKLIYTRLLQLESDNVNLYFRYGAFCVEVGDYETAEKNFISFIEQEILAPERLMDKANELAEQGRYRSAEWFYRFMMQQIPDDSFIYNNYALLLADLGRFDEAEFYFKKAIEEKDDLNGESGAHFNYANLLFTLDRIEEAEWFYDKALAQDPRDLPALNNYALLLIRKGEFKKAEGILKKILVMNPADFIALQNFSNLLLREKKFDEAIHHAQILMNSYPDHSQVYFHLATVLADSGKLEDAIDILNKALILNPDHVETITLLGVTLSELERFEESQEIFEQALVKHGSAELLRYHYAAMLFDWGKLQESERWIASLLEGNPDHGDALSLLGSVLKEQGKIYEARSLFERSIDKDPYNPEIWLQAALFYHATRDFVESDRCFNKALELSPYDEHVQEEKKRCEDERNNR